MYVSGIPSVALYVHHPESSLLPSPFIPTLASSNSGERIFNAVHGLSGLTTLKNNLTASIKCAHLFYQNIRKGPKPGFSLPVVWFTILWHYGKQCIISLKEWGRYIDVCRDRYIDRYIDTHSSHEIPLQDTLLGIEIKL